jgi:hypothetical protein
MKRALALALALGLPAAAHADDPPAVDEGAPMAGESIVLTSGSVRSMSSSWLILPRGWEATGELRFLTADAPPGGEPMRMTDVVVSRASLRKSIMGKVELAAAVDVLPKQPSYTDERKFQALDLGARVAVGRKHAVAENVAFGPMSNDQGWWVGAGLGLQRRTFVHETLAFDLAAGGHMTQMSFKDDERARLWELAVGGRTLFMAQEAFGLWFAADFAFPVKHSGDLMGGADFDPQTRVDISVGTVYSVVDNWDVYLQASIVDRGDIGVPSTQLPILQGGSDQRVITFGLTRHYGQDGGGYDSDMYAAY